MSQKQAKLLRKIARLSGRSDKYIKSEFKKMDKTLQQGYLTFMKENLRRAAELLKNPPAPKDTIVTDIPEKKGGVDDGGKEVS